MSFTVFAAGKHLKGKSDRAGIMPAGSIRKIKKTGRTHASLSFFFFNRLLWCTARYALTCPVYVPHGTYLPVCAPNFAVLPDFAPLRETGLFSAVTGTGFGEPAERKKRTDAHVFVFYLLLSFLGDFSVTGGGDIYVTRCSDFSVTGGGDFFVRFAR